MNKTINHAKNIFCFLDDILIVSKGSETEHEKLVETILKKLDDENLALKISKSEFFKNQVNWLVHYLSESGVSPKFTKTEAIQNLNPLELKQLRSFLGRINPAKFIPNAVEENVKGERKISKRRIKRKS